MTTDVAEGGAEICEGRNLTKRLARKFVGIVIAICGLPGRGKSLVAQSLSRRLNWNGESAKGKLINYFI